MGVKVREPRGAVNAQQALHMRLGQWGERLALAVYILHGYWPLPRPRFERVQTDLVVRRGNVLVLVEVKTRRKTEAYEKVLHPRQKTRLKQQVAFWAAQYPNLSVQPRCGANNHASAVLALLAQCIGVG